MNKTVQLPSIAVLGGSFNPLHYGHLRLAVEVYEVLRPARLDFVPCANPPHKRQNDLLPFELRLAMLKAATADHPEFYVNALEAERAALSFTADTLREYRLEYPETRLHFVLGVEDFEKLGSWREWRIIPELAELLVVARQGAGDENFRRAARRLWPEADEDPQVGRPAFAIGKAGRVSYLALPRLDVSASLIRGRWLEGRSIDYWTPREVVRILRENAAAVQSRWRAGISPRP